MGRPRRSGLLHDTRGATLVEYIILLGLVAIVAIAGLRTFGKKVDAKVQAQADCVTSLACSGEGAGVEGGKLGKASQAATAGKDDGGGFWGGLWNQTKNFVKGGVLGGFGGNTGWAGFAGKLTVGFIPVVGQIADARDTIASVIGVIKNPTQATSWTDLGASIIGWVPVAGDAAKEAIIGGREVAKALPGITNAVRAARITYGAGRQAGRGEPD